MSGDLPVTVHPDVADALHAGDAVVALEGEIEQAVRSSGAVPATIAVLNGRSPPSTLRTSARVAAGARGGQPDRGGA